MNLDWIAQTLGCETISTAQEITEISIDSRKISPGSLFAALKGEQFDGHTFMQEAQQKGAAAILCEHKDSAVTIPQLVVKDTLQALTKLASTHRQHIHCPIIALTGSNGKTSVKEMIASILPQPSHATRGNLNNHIGVPLSVLQLKKQHRYAVLELGANHLGEIAHTVAIVRPKVSLINNIGPAHIEGFGSIDGVAKAKGEIYLGLDSEGTAIVNDDDAYAHYWDHMLIGKRVIRFSLHDKADVFAYNIEYNDANCAQFDLYLPSSQITVNLNVPGEHNVRNALAAAACCFAIGIDMETIAQGLQHFQGVSGRLTFRAGKNHSLVIDDTYNANLNSVLTAVEVLAKRPGKRILVLGDMGELGQSTQAHHEEIGHAAQDKGIDQLLTCGKQSAYSSLAFGGTAKHYTNQEQLTQDLIPTLDKNTTVLVKGSRSAAMEKIVAQLMG